MRRPRGRYSLGNGRMRSGGTCAPEHYFAEGIEGIVQLRKDGLGIHLQVCRDSPRAWSDRRPVR